MSDQPAASPSLSRAAWDHLEAYVVSNTVVPDDYLVDIYPTGEFAPEDTNPLSLGDLRLILAQRPADNPGRGE